MVSGTGCLVLPFSGSGQNRKGDAEPSVLRNLPKGSHGSTWANERPCGGQWYCSEAAGILCFPAHRRLTVGDGAMGLATKGMCESGVLTSGVDNLIVESNPLYNLCCR